MLTAGHQAQPLSEVWDPVVRRRVLEALLGVPFTEGNQLDVLRNGNETFPAPGGDLGGNPNHRPAVVRLAQRDRGGTGR